MSTKIFIYYFLVERAYIVRGSRIPRRKTKLWLFNCLGMLCMFAKVSRTNFAYPSSALLCSGPSELHLVRTPELMTYNATNVGIAV